MKTRLLLIISLVLLGSSLAAWNAFGSFSIVTEPAGATVTVLGLNAYLGTTPTQQYPLHFNQNIVWNGGIAGHLFDLYITKDGYIPLVQRVFVPLNAGYPSDAEKNPSIYRFRLQPVPTAYYYNVDPNPSYYYPAQPNHHYNKPKPPQKPKPNHNSNQKPPNKMKPPRKK
ncbi:MAG: hypothetical protein GX294_03250 [Candidatus Cloacimonetes bacterium]|nr:hypothetical protein [Candidatus Cloacimonadota bacterium]